ncbi:MAG: hypothetical protein HY805_10930 [Nitrospirae bacterium]|nr:hypothetical protein [Nitrospirota bacterium]
MSNVSPAFKRRDIDYLLELLSGLAGDGKRILFLDIGADLGTFAVTVGNAFKGYEGLHVLAFEPAAQSYALLKDNIALNKLSKRTRCKVSPKAHAI